VEFANPIAEHQRPRQRATVQLQRVNQMLSDWEEFECAAAMPKDIRPAIERPTVAQEDLRELRAELLGVISHLEDAWERRSLSVGPSSV
jgi:hypothetical protein